jgi:predicted nucleic acid-binding Zn ribbon protein
MTHGGSRTHERPKQPGLLAQAVAELIALRGWTQARGHARLVEAWNRAAGLPIADSTKVVGLRRGILHVAVGNSPLLSELAAFHKADLLAALTRDCPDLKIRDLKFIMRGELSSRNSQT